MKNKREILSRKPQNITENLWYYEEPRGIFVMYLVGPKTYQLIIPWRKIIASVKRYKKFKLPKR